METKKELISFVIPCYGSENTIKKVVQDILLLMKSHPEYESEVVLINDSSPDSVWNKIEELCAENSALKGINLAKNFGQHSALMAGYNICRGKYIVTLDDDGQTPVSETFALLEKMISGSFDVVYAEYEERKDNFFRRFGTSVNNYMLTSLLGKPADIHLTSFFVARHYIIREICSYKNAFPYIWGLILRTTKNIANATVQHSVRLEGKSGYTIIKLISLWMNGFTAFSVKPLRMSAGLGCLFAMAGLAGAVFTVCYKLVHPDVAAGYSSLMSVLLIIGGMVMLSLGLIGEYVGRIYLCINNTPQFVIRETLNVSDRRNDD